MASKETSVKISEDSKEGQFNLDGILSELGSFGKYQLLLLLLLAFRDSFLNMCNFNYVFVATDVDFRCQVPECESSNAGFNASWSSYALPDEKGTCRRLQPYEAAHNGSLASPDFTYLCAPDNFAKNTSVACDKVVYEDYNSVVAEFDLGCEPWKAHFIGTIHNLGLVFSYVISGLISDKYGRKVIIVGTPLVVGVAGLIKSFSVNYWMLLVLEFLETAFGYGNASMVLSLESVTQKQRVMFSCIADLLSSIGSAFFGLIAWKVPYWRHLIRAIYAPLLIVVFYIFLIDEGVRWLVAHNKNDEAVRVLNKVAKINNIQLSNKAQQMLTKMAGDSKSQEAGESPPPERIRLFSVLRSKKILVRVLLIAASFVCCSFVYNGIIVNSTSKGVSGNKYLNFSALFLVLVPTRIITALTLMRFGRKAPICVAYTLCCVFFISSAFIPKSIGWTSMMLYLFGTMCTSYGLFAMNVVAMEVFPTTSRNLLTNIANTVGRVGTVLAPQTPLLGKYMTGLPSIVFGLVALVPAMLALLLPDTSQASLPDDVMDAENLDEPNEDNHQQNNSTQHEEVPRLSVSVTGDK